MSTAAPGPSPLDPLPPRVSRPRRRWPWIVLLVLLAIVLAVVGLVAWVFTTPQGARFVLSEATRRAGEGVKLEGVEGRLGGVLRIKRIEVSRPDLYALVEDLEMDTAPLAPLHGTLLVHRLGARSVELRTASSQATARVPVSFAPPYPVRLEEGRVGELRKGTLTREAAAEKDPARKRALMDATRASDLVVRDIYLKGGGTRTAWTIDEARAATAYGSGRVAGRLDSAPPFAIDMKAALQGRLAERDYRADVSAGGSLKSLQVDLDATVSGQRATGHATLEPFASFPLRALQVHAAGVDLAQQAQGPETRLTVDVNLAGAAEANAFAGPVRIENALPGRWDAKRLPFTAAAARVVVTRERVDVADLALTLLGGGSASGRGSLTQEGVDADLRVADVDLAALQGTLQKTRVSGRLAVSGDRAAQRFEVALKDPRFTIDGKGGLAQRKLTLASVQVGTGGGSVTASGELALDGRKPFHFEGRAQHFDPAAFVKTSKGDLNFAFDTKGTMAPSIAGEATLDIAPSSYAGLPASGRARLAGDAKRVAAADVDLAVGDARITTRGAFGAPGDALDFTFRAPNLATLAKPFGVALAGRADGEGRLTGTFQSPAGRIDLRGAGLSLPANVAVRDLVLHAQAGVDPQGPVDVELHAKGIAYGKETPPPPYAESLDATLKGTRAAHRLELAAVLTQDTSVRVALQGGLDERARALGWSGRVEQLAMTGRGAFSLQSPATLQASATLVELGDARLRGEWGEAHFITTRWTPRTLDLKGTSPGIVVQNLARSLRVGTLPRSDLVLAADWDVHGAETLDGHVSLKRVSGDLRVGEPPLPLGLQSLAVQADIVHGRASATAELAGDRVGRLQGRGSALIARGATGWSLAPDAPVSAHVVAEHTNIEALSPWLGVDGKLAGRVNATLDVSGTGSDPRLAGELRGADLAVREPQSGFEVEDGQVAVRLSGKSLAIERFSAKTPWRPPNAARERFTAAEIPASGTLQAEGGIDLEKRTGTLRLRADHAVVTQTPTRFVAISGEASLSATAEGMLASGKFAADAGWIGALDTPLPSVSEDVVVVRASQPPKEEAKKDSQPLRVDLTVALGRQVFFVGRGLDTRLGGDLHLTGTVGSDLRANGTIRTVGGTYKGYGQNLTVERGVLLFAGPLDNPQLNILALRKGLAVEAGVEVLGSATRPRVRLVSTPDVPEADKLSWLVLGRGPSELAPGDASVLLAAATSMLGGNNPGSDLGKKFGLDEVKIGRADTGNVLGVLPENTVAGRTGQPSAAEVVTVGKHLGKNVSLSYEQGLGAAEGALKVAWRISRPFQLLVRAGYLPGIDAVYRWTFR